MPTEYIRRAQRVPDAYDLIHHAWMQGAYASEFSTADNSMNWYHQRQYRMAWFAGFDIGRRIHRLYAERDRLAAEVERLKPYEAAIKNAHNGYSADARQAMPNLKEPATPEDAIQSLLIEAEALENIAIEKLVAVEAERDKLAADLSAARRRIEPPAREA